jgi:hypothetical protein
LNCTDQIQVARSDNSVNPGEEVSISIEVTKKPCEAPIDACSSDQI